MCAWPWLRNDDKDNDNHVGCGKVKVISPTWKPQTLLDFTASLSQAVFGLAYRLRGSASFQSIARDIFVARRALHSHHLQFIREFQRHRFSHCDFPAAFRFSSLTLFLHWPTTLSLFARALPSKDGPNYLRFVGSLGSNTSPLLPS